MGMFDKVFVTCPYCKKEAELQSKAGDCDLSSYTLHNAPLAILNDLANGGGWRICADCNKEIKIVADSRPTYRAETSD